METDISYLDRCGIIPSDSCKSIDDFLREAEVKHEFLDKLRSSPEEIPGFEKFPSLKSVAADRYYAERFFDETLTIPLPSLSLDKKDSASFLWSSEGPLSDKWFWGLAHPIDYKGHELRVPIVFEHNYQEKYPVSTTILHESVHCVRSQFSRSILNNLRYRFPEESLAYAIGSKNGFTSDYQDFGYFGFSSLVIGLCSTIPPLILMGGVFAYGVYQGNVACVQSPIYALCVLLPPNLYFAHRFSSFIQRCESEGMLPGYLLLRSNPHEFSKEHSLMYQLVHSDKPRFQVMAKRLRL